jgi:hypothetical protein
VNYHLFESYKKKPEHSTNVKKMMPLEEWSLFQLIMLCSYLATNWSSSRHF